MPKKINLDITCEDLVKLRNNFTNKQIAYKFGVSEGKIKSLIKEFKIYKNSNFLELPDLTNFQKQVILGSLLGDGALNKFNNEKSNSIFEKKAAKNKIEYLKWHFHKLKPYSKSFKEYNSIARKRINNTVVNDYGRYYRTCVYRTISHPYFTEIEHDWYKTDYNGNRIKIVPKNLEITPLMIALWYCDDGSNDFINKNISIYTQSFSIEDCEYLVLSLKNYDIKSKISFEHHKPIIYVGTKSYLNFINLIEKYFEWECMRYKIERIEQWKNCEK